MYQRAKQTGGGSGKAGDQTKGRVLLLKDAHYICYVVKAAKEKKKLYTSLFQLLTAEGA